MNTIKKFWSDDDGFIISVELLLILSLLIFGVMAGLIEVRNAVNEQFVAIADTIRGLNPNVSVPGIRSRTGGSNRSVGNQVFDSQVQTEFSSFSP